MKKTKENLGITLIAFVITIVVLLILAGISINLVLGENGIISKTKDAKEKTEYAQEYERVQSAIVDASNYDSMEIQTDNLKNALKKEFNLSDSEIENRLEAKSDNGPWIYTGDKGRYDINENGTLNKKLVSGLYDLNDNQIYDWNELLERSYIKVKDGVLTTGYGYHENSKKDYLVGKLVIDDSVTEIGEYGLGSLTRLEKVVLPESIILDEDSFYNTGIKSIGPKGSGASVELPKSLTKINKYTFEDCEALTYGVLDENISEVSARAFSGCENLEIQVSNNVKTVGTYSFYEVKVVCYTGEISTENWGCYNIHKFDTTGTCQICKYHKKCEFNGIEITLNNDNAFIAGYQKNITEELTIPDKVEYEGKQYTIVGIDDDTFSKDIKIRKVVMPSTVRSIGKDVLKSCSNLEEVYVSKNTIDIKNGFVSFCDKLKSIDIEDGNSKYMDIDGVCYSKDGKILIAYPTAKDCTNFAISANVEQLGNWCFSKTNINTIDIPSTIKNVGTYVFSKCNELTSISINADIVTIPSTLCYECMNLKNVTMSDKIKNIGYSAFAQCGKLEDVKLSNSLEKIMDAAFRMSTIKNGLNIPATVSEVGEFSFICYRGKTTNITFENYLQLKKIGDYAFGNCTINAEEAKQYILSINDAALEDPGTYGEVYTETGYIFEI